MQAQLAVTPFVHFLSLAQHPGMAHIPGVAKMTLFLLIEDDLNDVFFVERAFRDAPRHINLRHVGDGRGAIHYLEGRGEFADRQKFPLPDVILLDLKMPGFTGFEFLEWLRSKSPGDQRLIPVVVMSSSALPDDITKAYTMGVNSYLVKPVDWRLFRERIKTLGIYWADHVEKPNISHTEPAAS